MQQTNKTKSTPTHAIRHTFQSLVNVFPDLTFSMTYKDQAELHVEHSNGAKISHTINLLEQSDKQVREATFVIKERFKIFDD